MKLATILLGACLVACSVRGSSGPPIDGTLQDEFPRQCPTTTCAAASTLTSAAQLVSMIEQTSSWTPFGPYTTGCLTASSDVHITGTVTVSGDSIAVPAFCQGRQDCRKAVRFRSRPLPPGVECLQPEQWYGFTLCAGLTLRDATIRLRMVQQDIHPSSFGNAAPVVDVLGACEAPCGSTEFACEASHTCWATLRDHCAYCLAGTNEACACWTGTDFAEDGAHCEMAVSGDVYVYGTCSADACEPMR
jgi:hypothetical protein